MDFHYAIILAEQLYDVSGDTNELEEIGLIAYNFIGNKSTALYKITLPVNCEDGSIKLPCGIDQIEAVTYCGLEDWNYTSRTKNYGDRYSFYVESYIESQKAFTNPLYISGKYVKYRRVGDTLYVDKGLNKVEILYHGEILDKSGLPIINDKEAVAIADYIAYVTKYKEAIKTGNQNIMALALDIKKQWLKHCDAARTPESISQNEMDEILNVQASWDRKMYGKSYKPIK